MNPTYEQVCSGSTGHTEAVKVVFDKSALKYDDLLTVFWDILDPTTLNRQGGDSGGSGLLSTYNPVDDLRLFEITIIICMIIMTLEKDVDNMTVYAYVFKPTCLNV